MCVFLCVKGDRGLQGPPGPPGQVGEVSGLPDTVIQQGEKVTSFICFKLLEPDLLNRAN